MIKLTSNRSFSLILSDDDDVEIPDTIRFAEFVYAEGCYFFDDCYKNKGNASLELLYDETGFECFVNHIHLEYGSLESNLRSGLRIFRLIESQWNKSLYKAQHLRQILSFDNGSGVYRFHVVRDGQSWLAPDLNCYDELVIVVDSFIQK